MPKPIYSKSFDYLFQITNQIEQGKYVTAYDIFTAVEAVHCSALPQISENGKEQIQQTFQVLKKTLEHKKTTLKAQGSIKSADHTIARLEKIASQIFQPQLQLPPPEKPSKSFQPTIPLSIPPSLKNKNNQKQFKEAIKSLKKEIQNISSDGAKELCLSFHLNAAFFSLAKKYNLFSKKQLNALEEDLNEIQTYLKSSPISSHYFHQVIPHGISNKGADCCFISAIQLIQWCLGEKTLEALPRFFGCFTDNYHTLYEGDKIRECINIFSSQIFSSSNQEDASEILSYIIRQSFEQEPTFPSNLTELTPAPSKPKGFLQTTLHYFSSFITWCKELINHRILGIKTKPNPQHNYSLIEELVHKSSKKAKPSQSKTTSFLKQQFGQLHSEVTWDTSQLPKSLKHPKKATFKHFIFPINLPLSQSDATSYSFDSLLKQFCLEESVDPLILKDKQGNSYQVPKKQKATLLSSPEKLVINFKRFDYSLQKKEAIKISTPIEGLSKTFTVDKTIFKDKKSATYELVGFIKHCGSSPHRGHYITYVKVKDMWFCCNDISAAAVTEETALKEAKTSYLIVANKIKNR